MTEKTELMDFAELENRRDVAVAAAEAMAEEFARLEELADSPISGQTVIAIVSKLAPNDLIRVQERVMSAECRENGSVLKDARFNGPDSYYHGVIESINSVMKGYRDHIVDVFAKALANLSSDSSKAGDIYADIGRVEQLSVWFGTEAGVVVTDWTDIVPFKQEEGNYLLEAAPVERFTEHLDAFISYSALNCGSVWALNQDLPKIKERIRLLQLLHKRVHSYL